MIHYMDSFCHFELQMAATKNHESFISRSFVNKNERVYIILSRIPNLTQIQSGCHFQDGGQNLKKNAHKTCEIRHTSFVSSATFHVVSVFDCLRFLCTFEIQIGHWLAMCTPRIDIRSDLCSFR